MSVNSLPEPDPRAQQPRRDESPAERLDRNWDELLQELRVTQAGTQILTGFLLTLAFQPRFVELDDYQITVYLALVVLAAVCTGLGLTPVSLHRALFRKHAKERIVVLADTLVRVNLLGVAALLTGTTLLIFDVVVSRAAGLISGAAALFVTVTLWAVLPLGARWGARRPDRTTPKP